MPKFAIGEYIFQSEKEAQDKINAIRHNSIEDTPLIGEDDTFMRCLITYHDDYGRTTRFNYIKHIAIRRSFCRQTGKRIKEFYIENFDGTLDVFSGMLKHYVGIPEDKKLRAYIGECCGLAIRDVILEVKLKAFSYDSTSIIKCQDTGISLNWNDADVDHSGEWPMSRIIDEWISTVTLSWDMLAPAKKLSNGHKLGGHEFKPEYAEKFLRFHNERAILRVIDHIHNIRKGNSGYRRVKKPSDQKSFL